MIKGLKIAAFLTLLVAFAACEKCEKPMFTEDPFVNSSNRASDSDKEDSSLNGGNRGEVSVSNSGGGDGQSDSGITDPNEDEDFDGIVDPDEDEDFDQEDDGK